MLEFLKNTPYSTIFTQSRSFLQSIPLCHLNRRSEPTFVLDERYIILVKHIHQHLQGQSSRSKCEPGNLEQMVFLTDVFHFLENLVFHYLKYLVFLFDVFCYLSDLVFLTDVFHYMCQPATYFTFILFDFQHCC